MSITRKRFAEIDLQDPFFDSLKADYKEFSEWFERKANETAYVFQTKNGRVDGFLYLKTETGPVDDVDPPLPASKRIKVGTFKINAHGTKLGERFVKKIFDHAIEEGIDELYVTVFEKHEGLLRLLELYGFRREATKKTRNGEELVMIKRITSPFKDVNSSYPLVNISNGRAFLLSLYPEWHTRLLPDSILRNENASIVEDVSHTNSIHKVYLAGMRGMEQLRTGDSLLIYRTSDNKGPARYRSVATSVCVVEEYRHIGSFGSEAQFLKYCRPFSVFSDDELRRFWAGRRYPHVIRFSYNIALRRRVTRGEMIDDLGYDQGAYWGFLPLSREQFMNVIRRGGVNESLIVD